MYILYDLSQSATAYRTRDSCRVGPSNEAVTGRGDGKMDGVDEENDGGSAAAAAAALCVATL